MHTILQAFANDALRVETNTDQRSVEHQKICDLSDELEQKLSKRLKDEEKELLRKLIDTLASESGYYAEKRFIRGYQLGVLMTMEVFIDPDIFMWKGVER